MRSCLILLGVCAAGMVVAPCLPRAEEAILRIAKTRQLGGGRRGSIDCATNDGGDPNSTRWPSGHVVVDNVYATYQYPADQRYPYPILFNSGGGHTARVYDTTPDGREGWLTLFLREGFPVYGVDRSEHRPLRHRHLHHQCGEARQGAGQRLPAINRYAADLPG